MEISFILSTDEIYTLMSLFPDHTDDGRRFAAEALSGATPCDLSSLVDKKLAKPVSDKLEVAPVIRMLIDAIARADIAEIHDDVWSITSPWVSLRCEKYPYQEGFWKITPHNGDECRES